MKNLDFSILSKHTTQTYKTFPLTFSQNSSFEEQIEIRKKTSELILVICNHCDTTLADLRVHVADNTQKIEIEAASRKEWTTFYGCLQIYLKLGIEIIRMFVLDRIKSMYRNISSIDQNLNSEKQIILSKNH